MISFLSLVFSFVAMTAAAADHDKNNPVTTTQGIPLDGGSLGEGCSKIDTMEVIENKECTISVAVCPTTGGVSCSIKTTRVMSVACKPKEDSAKKQVTCRCRAVTRDGRPLFSGCERKGMTRGIPGNAEVRFCDNGVRSYDEPSKAIAWTSEKPMSASACKALDGQALKGVGAAKRYQAATRVLCDTRLMEKPIELLSCKYVDPAQNGKNDDVFWRCEAGS